MSELEYYNLYGLNVLFNTSNTKKSYNTNFDVNIYLGKVDSSDSKEILNEKNIQIALNDINKDIFIFLENIGKFQIHDGTEIIVEPFTNVNLNKIRSCLFGSIFGILLNQRGFLVLHGSAIKVNDGVVAFLGHSGNGKSTMAMYLNKNGYPFISDDILAIKFNDDIPIVFPGLPQSKLSVKSIKQSFDDSKEIPKIIPITEPDNRYCCVPFNHSQKNLPLKRIYIIERSSERYISKLNNSKTLFELVNQSYNPGLFNNIEKKSNLLLCAKIVENVDISFLKVNHNKKISETITLIEDDFADRI